MQGLGVAILVVLGLGCLAVALDTLLRRPDLPPSVRWPRAGRYLAYAALALVGAAWQALRWHRGLPERIGSLSTSFRPASAEPQGRWNCGEASPAFLLVLGNDHDQRRLERRPAAATISGTAWRVRYAGRWIPVDGFKWEDRTVKSWKYLVVVGL